MTDFLQIAEALALIVWRAVPGLAVVLVAVAVYGAARYLRTAHRAGVARLAAHDARTADARRRARTNARTVIDVDPAGTVHAVTVEPRRTR